jgi:sugar lactone lactonase YvrE
MMRRFLLAAAIVPVICLLFLLSAGAQTPTALPYTMTTIAGTSPMSATIGTQCPGLPTGVKSTDAFGDGCLAVNGSFGTAARGGVTVDSFGNVFVNDDVNKVLHMINPTTGIMTVAAGNGATCSGKVTSAGDGCIAVTQTTLNSQRGIGMDPYGNVLLAGYGDGLLHVVCRAVSPLCSASQIGYMEMLGGCVATTGGGSTGSSSTLIGLSNLPAKVVGATCSLTSGGVLASPRGIAVDIYGNIFFADTSTSRFRVILGPQTSSYFSGTNPLYAALNVYYPSLTAGYFYTVANTLDSPACYGTYTAACGGSANSPPTSGVSCSVTTNGTTYSGVSTDIYGDGCPFEFSSVASSSGYTTGVAVDAAGNLIFTDPTHGLRVFFVSGSGAAGTKMASAISANNAGVTPQAGFIYMLAGGGSTGISATPTLGNSTSALDSSTTKLTVSPQGNIYIGDSSKVLFFDINTGYIRTLFTSTANVTAGNYCSGSSGQESLSAYSDACPASKSLFSNSNGLGDAVDGQGNLYLFDSASNATGMLVRKVLAQGMAEQTLGTPLIQTFDLHFPESASGTVAGSSATLTMTSDTTSAAAPACAQNADHSVDCTVTVTDTPNETGLRSASLMVGLPTGTWANSQTIVGLGGTVTGSVLTVDSASSGGTGVTPTTNAIFSSITPYGMAVDGGGNVYTSNGVSILESIGGTAYTLYSSLPGALNQLAIDQTGNIFTVNSGASTIEKLVITAAGTPATYAATTLSYTPTSGTAAPQAIAVDRAGNLYVADYQSGGASIYKLSQVANTLQYQTTVATGLNNPVSLAVDGSGNVYAADKDAGSVYEFTPSIVSGLYTYMQSTKLSSVTPVAVAVDSAGDVYVQSGTSVLEIPVSGPETTVLTGLQNPTGLAVDGLGNVYSADAHNTSITQAVRDNVTENFGTSTTTDFTATLTNVGNQASTGQNTSTSNTTNFVVTGGSSNGCAVSTNVLGAVSAGQACTLSAQLTGGGTTTVDDYITFLPSASTAGELTLTGTLQGVSYPTTSTIGTATGALIYAYSGIEASFTITVAASTATSAPNGSVNVYVDSATALTQYPLTAATSTSSTATVNLTGLTAGGHTIAVVYPTTGQFTGSGSTAATAGFSIAQAATSVSWTPSLSSQPVSQAVGTGVLDAIATTSDATAVGFGGSFAYTVTPAGGSATTIDASSYLQIGTYSLAVTFTPADAVDYATSTASVATYTVTKASTTAVVGASTNVVAADGTGNYTSLSAALAALPVTGGTLYLKPGTYTGQNAISYPNVRLRGLGGNAANVILTAEDGAFSAPFIYPGSGPGNANASGDQGSSTLDVTKGTYMGTTAGSATNTPNNFYAEYLTIQNTYDTDTKTTTTWAYNSGTGLCSNTGTASTLASLYNSGTQCASQALALWIESDQAILNNVNLTSQQDTLFAGSQGCGSTCTVARQYLWQGTITGDVDYVFGDAAMVFDHTNFFTTWHGNTATGTETIEAQNKKFETGSSSDYLSGYICNSCTLMSQSTGMTNLFYGRPYGAYSTWIMLNSYVDQVAPVGWIEFSGDSNLPTSTYAEYNTQAYIDPAVGTAPYPAGLFYESSIPGYAVIPTGLNIGAGVTGTRETTSTDPGTIEASNSIKTVLTAAQAAQYYPVNFLGTTLSSSALSSGQSSTWNPVTALASAVNAFAPTGNVALNSGGSSVTILGRPQTPGAGIIPTGTYTFKDSLNGGTATTLASGNLDASGEAYLTTSTLPVGVHTITMVYGGDSNFSGSTSSSFTITVPEVALAATTTALTVTNASSTYGGTIAGKVTVTPTAITGTPSSIVTLMSGATTLGACTLSGGSCTFSLTSVAAGAQTLTASYSGDTTFAASTSNGVAINVARVILQVRANNATMVVGGTLPALTYTTSGYVNSDTSAVLSGLPSLTTTATGSAVGEYPIAITTGTLAASNYTFAFTGGYLYVTGTAQAPAVATGDTRAVTEPVFPAVCTQLNADITQVNNDIPASVDTAATPLTNANLVNPTVTNPDGGRIQAALNACSASYPGTGPGLAVELSVDGAGNNAFLSGPLTMPSNVTLLVDPGIVLFFSRNAQDYDTVPGTHTCGTISTNSASSSCLNLMNIPGTSTNVGIMGYGKLDGRGGDTLINAIAPYQGYSWWGLSAAYTSPDSQQNPRWVQMNTGASNITLYKITLRNAPMFHITTGGAVTNFTAWDIKIVTPTSSRNTDGIDPGDSSNITITRSWISDGDDNVAAAAAHTASANLSITNNHFFAGHGQSIGSYTGAGVSNLLWDGNIASGNGFANHGSASITGAADSNSTGIRIKSANDRGGLITNIQYSNECLLDHAGDIQFTPLYNTNTGTQTPNLKNILIQNVAFLNDDSTTGNAQFTGAVNGTTINPLYVILDNVTFPSAFSSSSLVTTGSAGTEQYADLTYGPGDVSSNFITAWASVSALGTASNHDTVTNNITATSLNTPACGFTYIAPELTGPTGLPQTISYGQNATAVVILTPAVGDAAYPTGTVTLTDTFNSSTSTVATVSLTGNTDTVTIPLTGLAVGTHTINASYGGDTNYVASSGAYSTAGPYVITVNSGTLGSSTTALSGVPSVTTFGTPFTATASVSGGSPTGSVQFVISGGGNTSSYTYATMALNSGTASASIDLPYSSSAYTVTAVYSGDSANAGSTSSAATVAISQGITITALSVNTTATQLGHPVLVTATVSSLAGTPTGTVNFTYSTTSGGTQIAIGSSSLNNGAATVSADLPVGTNYITATYLASGSYAGSSSTVLSVTVGQPTIIPIPHSPIALPYTITTIAGGGAAVPSSGNMLCTGATDKYGDGCQATAMAFTSGDDLRGVDADPFGNVYVTDPSATRIRRIAPNGVISTFAGGGSTCTLPASTSAKGTGCTPTLVSIGKARGVSSDAAGNIYIADYGSGKVYEVKVSDGLMYLVAGNGTPGTSGDGGPAGSAELASPRSVWGDTIGNIYIADTGNNKIRVVDATGNIHTFAGNGTAGSNGDSGPATSAEINNPQGVIVDANLNVYIADSSGGRIRVVCVTCGTGSPLDALLAKLGISSPVNGDIYTVAGSGSTGAFAYTAPVLSTGVSMAAQKLAFDNASNLYISDGNGVIWFLDFHTGYLRAIASNAATVCAGATDAFGDGCPATQAKFGDGGNGIGVGADTQGNIYISDTTNGLIRKVITGLASPSTATATTNSHAVELHFTAGDTLAAGNGLAFTSSEWALGTPACAANADTTSDCLLTSGFTPAVPGARSTPLTVNSSLANTANLALTGTGLGAGSTLDPASRISFGASLHAAGLATDNAGNVYVADANSKKLLRFAPSAQSQGAGAASTTLATLTAPGPVAVDARGYVYVGDTSTGLITQIAPSGTTSTLALTLTTPAGLAVDALNNLYVSDSSTQAVYQLNPITGAVHTLAVGTLVAPAGLAIDPSDNLLIADPGAPAIYRFNLQSGVTTTVSSPAAKPSALAIDAAGNLLIADTASIFAVPASANSAAFTVAGLAPSALAIDAAGNLYTGSGSAILKLVRTQSYIQFTGALAAPQTVSLLESGNQALQLTSVSQTDTADYSLTATASTDCTLSGSLPSTVAVGGACALTATYTPTTFITTTDTATFNGNLANAALSTPPSVQLVLTGPATAPTAAIALNPFSPASPAYGQTVTVSATVSGPAITPAGTVVFTVDGATTTATLASGVASISLNGLSIGTHTVSAAYTSSNGFTSASTSPVTLTVSKTPLIVTATNTSRAVGAANPTFTVTYSGFVNGDTAASLSGSPALSTTATSSSPAGTYPITVTQGTLSDPNYAFTFVNGTLSVVQAPTVTITATATLAKVSGNYQATITVTNSGTGAAANMQLTSATLGSAAGSPLPQNMGTLAAGGGSATVTVTFPASAGSDGATVAEKYSFTYTGGTFSYSLRAATLP